MAEDPLAPNPNPTSQGFKLPEPDAPINAGVPGQSTGENEAGIGPSRMDQFVTNLKLQSEKLPIGIPGLISEDPGSVTRAFQEYDTQQAHQDTADISPEEANKRFPGMPEGFSQPVNPFVAESRFNAYKRQQKLQDWKERGGPTPWTDFGVGVVGGFTDPLNLAVNIASGGLAKEIGIAGSFRNIFLQNLAINEGLGAVSYGAEKMEGLNPSASDYFGKGAVEGAIGATMFHYAMAGVAKLSEQAMARWKGMPKDLQESGTRAAIESEENGQKPNTTPTQAQAESRMRGDIEGQSSPYRFTPSEHPSDRPFYAAKDSSNSNVETHSLGPGTYMTDDGQVANNLAANPSGNPGMVGEFHIPEETKLLNLDETVVEGSQAKAFADETQKKLGVTLDLPEDATLKDVLEKVSALEPAEGAKAPIEATQDIAKEMGYEGYQYKAGTPESPKNGAMLFDDKAQPQKQYVSNPDTVPKESSSSQQAAEQQAQARENGKYSTPELEKQAHDLRHGEMLNSTPDAMDLPVKEMYDSAMGQLQEMAKTDPDVAEHLEDLKREFATLQQEKAVAEKFTDCVGGA